MVSCDQCGVWVHTRCGGYSRSEKAFYCHKCKAANGGGEDGGDPDEAEVAKLLAELPMKPVSAVSRSVFRRWAELPLAERVHVHGGGGAGESDLFRGLPPNSAFTPALWRCAGYVPKKFGFRYQEAPPCGEEDGSSGLGTGADALFALSESDRSLEKGNSAAVQSFGCRPDSGQLKVSLIAAKHKNWLPALERGGGEKVSDECGKRKDRDEKKLHSGLSKKKVHNDYKPITHFHSETKLQEVGKCDDEEFTSDDGERHTKKDKNPTENHERALGKKHKAIACFTKEEDPGHPLHPKKLAKVAHSSEASQANVSPMSVAPEISNSSPIDGKVDRDLPAPVSTGVSLSSERGLADTKTNDAQPSIGESKSKDNPVPAEMPEKTDDLSAFQIGNKTPTDQQTGASNKSENFDREPKGNTIKHQSETNAATKGNERVEDMVASLNEESSLKHNRSSNGELNTETQGSAHRTSVVLTYSRSYHLPGATGSSFDGTNLASPEQSKVVSSIRGKMDDSKFSASTEVNYQENSRPREKSQQKVSSSTQKQPQANKAVYGSGKSKLLDQREKVPKPTLSGESNKRSFPDEPLQSHSRSRAVVSNIHHKKEKTPSRAMQSKPGAPDNIASTDQPESDAMASLSDEQFAFLLHQQLNSSPRLPRGPRVQQVLQRAQSTATPAPSKRSGMGRDQFTVPKKRNREDVGRDHSLAPQSNDDSVKLSKVPRLEHEVTAQAGIFSAEESLPGLNESVPFSRNEATPGHSKERGSAHQVVGDDSVDNPEVLSNLLGLIEDIFNKNKDIRYSELCDAVYPHLRKPNGERYAYTSCLCAVNDCLRNRSDWAHLLEQAPKTSLNKHRRRTGITSSGKKSRNKAQQEEETDDRSIDSQSEGPPKGRRRGRRRAVREHRGRKSKAAVKKRASSLTASEDDDIATSGSLSSGNDTQYSNDDNESHDEKLNANEDKEQQHNASSSSDDDAD